MSWNWLDNVEGKLAEAWSGNLSAYDKQQIIDNGKAEIAKAGAGLEPGIVAYQQSMSEADINAALNSFCGPGDTGSECGAQPSLVSRLPIVGSLNLENLSDKLNVAEDYLKWGIVAAAGIAILFFGFPYIAPQVAANLSAARSLKK